MTPEQEQQIISFLAGIDYSDQEQRNAAVQMIDQARQFPQLSRQVADAIAQADARLREPGGVSATGPQSAQYEPRILGFRSPASYIDELGVLIGAVTEMETTKGRRYVDALVQAVAAGDPAAMNQLDSILAEDSDVSDRTRSDVRVAIERITNPDREIQPEQPAITPAAAEMEGEQPPAGGQAPAQEQAPEPDGAPGVDFDLEASAAAGAGGGIVGYYGVPLETLDEEGTRIPWEAIVNGEGVAPRYAEGYSRQPGRFGFNNEEQIARVQFQMEAAGLLEPGSYMPGVWDARTAGRSNTEGWRSVLAFSNMNGMDWEEGFARMYDAGVDAEARGLEMELDRLRRNVFFADPAELRSRARRFLLEMGRLPSQIDDEELDMLTEEALYGVQQARMRTVEEQIQRRTGQGELGGQPIPETIQSETFQTDPVSYFDRELEKLMSREIEGREAQQMGAQGERRFSRISGAIGSAG